MTVTVLTLVDTLEAVTATGGTFDPAATYCGLFTSLVNSGINTLLSALTLCTGALATAKAVTSWTDPYWSSSTNLVADGALLSWATAEDSDAQLVGGYYFATAATDGDLLGFTAINPPTSVVYPYGRISIVPRVALTQNGITDESQWWND